MNTQLSVIVNYFINKFQVKVNDLVMTPDLLTVILSGCGGCMELMKDNKPMSHCSSPIAIFLPVRDGNRANTYIDGKSFVWRFQSYSGRLKNSRRNKDSASKIVFPMEVKSLCSFPIRMKFCSVLGKKFHRGFGIGSV